MKGTLLPGFMIVGPLLAALGAFVQSYILGVYSFTLVGSHNAKLLLLHCSAASHFKTGSPDSFALRLMCLCGVQRFVLAVEKKLDCFGV